VQDSTSKDADLNPSAQIAFMYCNTATPLPPSTTYSLSATKNTATPISPGTPDHVPRAQYFRHDADRCRRAADRLDHRSAAPRISCERAELVGCERGRRRGRWTPGQDPQPASPNNESFTFYWVNAGMSGQATYTVSYTWTLNNGFSNSATATFKVAGPTPQGPNGAFMTSATGRVNVWPTGVAFGGRTPAPGPALELGNANTENGISFEVTATPPQQATGTFLFVQLLGPDATQYRTNPPRQMEHWERDSITGVHM
jgi:hypothetical protein